MLLEYTLSLFVTVLECPIYQVIVVSTSVIHLHYVLQFVQRDNNGVRFSISWITYSQWRMPKQWYMNSHTYKHIYLYVGEWCIYCSQNTQAGVEERLRCRHDERVIFSSPIMWFRYPCDDHWTCIHNGLRNDRNYNNEIAIFCGYAKQLDRNIEGRQRSPGWKLSGLEYGCCLNVSCNQRVFVLYRTNI